VSRGSCHTRYGSRAKAGLSATTTAGAIECSTANEDGSETLAITSGGHSGAGEERMLQLMPGNGPPKTAVGRQRTRAGMSGGNVGFREDGKKSQGGNRPGRGGGSLGLSHVLSGQADENIPNSLLRQIPPKSSARGQKKMLLGRIEQSKYITERDLQAEGDKKEEMMRQRRVEENHFQPPLFVSPDVKPI